MSKVANALGNEHIDDGQDRLYWESYCNLHAVLSQEAFVKAFNGGTYEDFCLKIDEMNREAV